MSQSLEEILQQCTVKLSIPGRYGHGTGFMVAPGLILTCAHVVKALDDEESIAVRWQNQENFAQATFDQALPAVDLALLRFTPPNDAALPCVYLDESIKAGDDLYLFGYPDQDYEDGCPVTGICEGLTGDASPLIKFKLGQVRPGMSGSPLLNLRTGKVCGIVKSTRDRSSDLGGEAIPTSVVFEELGKLKKLQKKFHRRDRRWRDLLVRYKPPSIKLAALTAVGVSTLVTVSRLLGLFQGMELWAYDGLMRSKLGNHETLDDRIALVSITANDLKQFNRPEISDRDLTNLIREIQGANPQSIGIDIFRDIELGEGENAESDQTDRNSLIELLEKSPQPVIICRRQAPNIEGEEPPSKNVRVGFSNTMDDGGHMIRRQLLHGNLNAQDPCQAEHSLSYELALDYLEVRHSISAREDKKGRIKLGATVLYPVWSDTGGYQRINDGGYQVLLNYRKKSFHMLEASEVLDNLSEDEQSKLKGKIVLVGYDETDAAAQKDMFNTPLGRMPGLEIHAHMISYLLSIVIDDEYALPQIRTWEEPEEVVWIFFWSVVGGSLPLLVRSFPDLGLTIIGSIVVITAICWSVFAFGGWWLPLVPVIIVLILTPVTAVSLVDYQQKLNILIKFTHE